MDEVDKKTKDIIEAIEKKRPIKLRAMSWKEFDSVIKKITEYVKSKHEAEGVKK